MKKIAIILSLAAVLASCEKPKPVIPIKKPVETLNAGDSSFVFTSYEPLATKPVKVYYYIPEDGDMNTMPILFAMHGSDRNAPYQIENWRDVANDKKVMVFAPEFTKELYPEVAYQFGGVSRYSSTYEPVAKEKWTYNILEALFDYVKEATDNSALQYDLWGHSAGGQWTHRFMFYMPQARVRMAVESNAGNYTVPTPDGIVNDEGQVFGWPHSLKYTTFNWDDVRAYLAKNMVVHLGTADIVQDSYFPKDAGSMTQGPTRFARGHYFFDTAKEIAEERGWEFNWTLKEVEGIGHNSRGMVNVGTNAAAVLLYGNR